MSCGWGFDKFLWDLNFFRTQNFFQTQNFFRTKHFFGTKNLWWKRKKALWYRDPKFFMTRCFLTQNVFSTQNLFQTQNFFSGPKFFFYQTFLSGTKIFFWPNIFFGLMHYVTFGDITFVHCIIPWGHYTTGSSHWYTFCIAECGAECVQAVGSSLYLIIYFSFFSFTNWYFKFCFLFFWTPLLRYCWYGQMSQGQMLPE